MVVEMHAETMNCASCGAAVASDSPICGHCGARLATMACPSCFNMMVAGSRFCSQCGGAAVHWRPTEEKLPCPGCDGPLLLGKLGESALFQCGKCFGFWVNKTTLERICRNAEKQALTFHDNHSPSAHARVMRPIRYVRCPECHKLMNRVNFAQCSGTVVDVCSEHGTWFDANELQQIARFLREGGMDKVRAQQMAALESERRRLRGEQRLNDRNSPTPWGRRGSDMEPLDEIWRTVGTWLSSSGLP